MNVFRTLIIPSSVADAALRLTDALGYPHKGMFVERVLADDETVGLISTGHLPDDSPFLTGNFPAGDPDDVAAVTAALDLTEAEPFARQDLIREEVAAPATGPAWSQPTGAHNAYPLDAIVSHKGLGWRNLTPANVWEPGVSGWRLTWGQPPADEWPAWVQPTGAHDAYQIGDKVSHAGKRWISTEANNVWEPGTFGWTEKGQTPVIQPEPQPGPQAWAIDQSVAVGDLRSHAGKVWKSKVAHTTHAGWEPSEAAWAVWELQA